MSCSDSVSCKFWRDILQPTYTLEKQGCVLTVGNVFGCRKAVENVLHKMLLSDHVGYSLVPHLLPCLRSLHSSTDSLVTYLAETVAEIRQPITSVEKSVSAEERRKIDVQV